MPRLLPRSFLIGLSLLVLALVSGCETTSPTTNQSDGNPRLPEPATAAVLRSGDSLVVSLQGIPDPSQHNQQIDDQGLLNLPYIGGVHAEGLTASALSDRIRATYIERNYYRTIDVSVTVTERYVYVGGEVQRPGRIVWTPDLTMTKAIQAAGGFTIYAKEGAVSVVRDQSAYSLDARLAQRSPAQDPRLFPGDSIQVDRTAF